MELYTENTKSCADEKSNRDSRGALKQTLATCHQCNGDKVFYYHDGKDCCTLCDDEGMVPA